MLNTTESTKKSFFYSHYPTWNVVLIDDDVSFRLLIEQVAKSYDMNITAFESLSSIPTKKDIHSFDAIILDYYLEQLNGVEIAQYINSFFPNTPVLLISGEMLCNESEAWPDCIKAFLPKCIGPSAILEETTSILHRLQKQQAEKL